MSDSVRMMGSDYMHWAKTRSSARFNLAVSGMLDLPFSDLQLETKEFKNLELTRGGGYGYAPLQEAAGRTIRTRREFYCRCNRNFARKPSGDGGVSATR